MEASPPLRPNPNANQTGNHWPDVSGTFKPVTRASVRSIYMPTSPEVVVPDTLLPDPVPQELSPSPVLTGGTVPKVRPILLDLRNRLLQRRIDKIEGSIDQLSHPSQSMLEHEEMARHVGRSILTSKGYWPHTESRRPYTLKRTMAARALESLDARRRKNVARAHSTAKLFKASDTEHFVPDFEGSNPHPTRFEARDTRSHAKSYNKNMRQAARRDRMFASIVSPRSAYAQRLLRKRDKLSLKQQAIEHLRTGKPIERQSELPQGELIQYGNPDARGKVSVNIEYSQPADVNIDISSYMRSRGKRAEIVIYNEDGTTLYIHGNTLYSWKRNAEGEIIQNMQELSDLQSELGFLPRLSVGRPLRVRNGISSPESPIIGIVVHSGNMNSQIAIEKHMRRKANDPLDSARRIARHIDNSERSD
ncbi:MAG TPA: hypothetical protein VLF79_01385 [Candidatus Saccharimonadales bacterium]|nr:hypothetical protein [Candidatus Saccharimonadales bacterium]